MARHTPQPHPELRRSPRPAPRPENRSGLHTAALTISTVAGDRRSSRQVPRRRSVYRRRRAVALLFVVVVVATVLALAFVSGRATADGSSDRAVRPAAVYVVRPGDTLWDIAVQLAPDRDPRITTAALERAAGGASIRAGQRIVLPASLQR